MELTQYIYYSPLFLFPLMYYFKTNILYNLIKGESRAKVLYRNIKDLFPYFLKKTKNNCLYAINDEGEVIDYPKKTNDNSNIKLIIYEKIKNDDSDDISDKIFYYTYDMFNKFESKKETKFKFMAIQLNYNNNTYNIKLHSENFTFYIQDNIVLSKEFIKWYMFKFLNVKIKNENYKINIMDNLFKNITLKPNEKIKLSENSYNIIS